MNHCPLHARDFDGDDICPDCKGLMAAEISGEEAERVIGRDFSEDKKAIAELRSLSREAKEFLNHHIRNAVTGVVNYCNLERCEEAKLAALQLVAVLEAIAPAPEVETVWPDAHGF
jgi:hypothetical protein